MKFYADLHIHSALSPCADRDMTPNNIINMAVLKGLDIIAVTDHNSAENLPAVSECARKAGIVFIPGMEVETREEIHLVCLFPHVEAAFAMQDVVYGALPDLKNREDIFGEQWILDEEDRLAGRQDRLLLTATGLGIGDVFPLVKDLGGVVLPAHVDRDSYSVLSNLGSIPEDLPVRSLEISRDCCLDSFLAVHPELNAYSFIRSSDAHYLWDISERENPLQLEEAGAECLMKALSEGNV